MNSSKSNKTIPSILGVATVNEKGQVVIPVSARAVINLQSGDKLLVMAHPNKEGVTLIKPDSFELYANQMLKQLDIAKKHLKQSKD